MDEDEVDLVGSESNGILTPLEQNWSLRNYSLHMIEFQYVYISVFLALEMILLIFPTPKFAAFQLCECPLKMAPRTDISGLGPLLIVVIGIGCVSFNSQRKKC